MILFLIATISCKNEVVEKEVETTAETAPILGSWKVTSIYWITKDTTYSIENAQPGMLLFTPNRYAIMWTPTEEPRVPFQKLSAPTDDELKAGFRSIVFNSGTYEFSDSTITTQAEIAKVPGFEGGQQFYKYKIVNNEMELTMFDELYPNGSRPEWFGRYETKFVLKKIE